MTTKNLSSHHQDLVHANRILVAQGVLDGFGHVSVRDPQNGCSFLLSRNLAPALVTLDDIQEFDLHGNTQDNRPSYLERYIHAAIYRARPDVHAIVHSHSASVLPYASVDRPLRPISHMAGFLHTEVPAFEIRKVSGDATDLLIRSHEQGDALAERLGLANVVLMRGHGSVAVATSLRAAVFNAVYTERNAETQARAEALGEPVFLTPDEARSAEKSNASQIDRAWNYWLAQVPQHERQADQL